LHLSVKCIPELAKRQSTAKWAQRARALAAQGEWADTGKELDAIEAEAHK
jgi:hypothetical protein